MGFLISLAFFFLFIFADLVDSYGKLRHAYYFFKDVGLEEGETVFGDEILES